MSLSNGSLTPALLTFNEIAGYQELISSLPQEAAADVSLAKEIGSSLFIACSIVPPAGENPLSNLKPIEYEAMVLAAEGFINPVVAQALGPWVTTNAVRVRLHKGYVKLGVPNKSQAGHFIPINERRLRSIPPHGHRKNSSRYPLLDETLSTTFHLLGEGYTPQEVASRRPRSYNTILAQMAKIGDYFGLDAGPQGHAYIQVERMAVAMRNLNKYAGLIASAAADIQPQVTTLLAWAEAKDRRGPINLDSQVVHATKNQAVLADLKKNNYVSPDIARDGQLDLPSFIAAMLLNKAGNRAIMENELTRSTVREIIQQEARHFISKRQES